MTSLQSNTRLARLRAVYHLCLFRQREDPRSFVPDPTQFPLSGPRSLPYIFSDAEIIRLLTTVESLAPHKASPLHCEVARVGIVILYTTGLRRGELVRLTLGDYDNDGWLDLLVSNNGEDAQLFRNTGGSEPTAKNNHWLGVRLIGAKSNRDGIGAAIKITAGDFVSYDQVAQTTTLTVNSKQYSLEGVTMPSNLSFLSIGRNPTYNLSFTGQIENVFVFNNVLSPCDLGILAFLTNPAWCQ